MAGGVSSCFSAITCTTPHRPSVRRSSCRSGVTSIAASTAVDGNSERSERSEPESPFIPLYGSTIASAAGGASRMAVCSESQSGSVWK